MAASLKGSSAVVKMLIEHGANVNAFDDIGCTPLVYALYKKNNEIIEILIASNADVNAVASGMTPLMYASVIGNKEIAEMLLLKGANVSAKNNDGATPLMMAVLRGFTDVAKILIEYGADVNDGSDGFSIMMAAQYKNNKEMMELLRSKGAKGENAGCCSR
jgi:ankyrin repeat protein